jgi:hypothetical protein
MSEDNELQIMEIEPEKDTNETKIRKLVEKINLIEEKLVEKTKKIKTA